MPGVQLICDPHDDVAIQRHAARAELNEIPVCRVTPGAEDRQLARDLLRSLGKRTDLSDTPREPEALWRCARIWIAAESPPEVLILRAHTLTLAQLTRVLETLGPRTWPTLHLCARRPTAKLLAMLDQSGYWIVEPPPIDDEAPATPGPQPLPPPLPALPREAFTLFLDACEQQLEPDVFAYVDELVQASRAQTRRWLRERAPLHLAQTRAQLRTRLCAAEDAQQARVIAVGMQVELLLSGEILAGVDAATFTTAHAHQRRHASPPGRHATALLRGYCSPQLASLGAVALITDESPDRLAALRDDALSRDAARLRTRDAEHEVPPGLRPVLLAARLARGEGSQTPGAALLSHRRDLAPPTPATIRGGLRCLARETGLSFRHSGHPESDQDWASRHGITLAAL